MGLFRAVPKECHGSILQGLRSQIPPKHIRAPPNPNLPLRYTQMPSTTPPRYPKEILREHKALTDNNRRQQTQRDGFRHPKKLTGAV